MVTDSFKILMMVKDTGLGLPNSPNLQEKNGNVFYIKISIFLCAQAKTIYSCKAIHL